MGAQSPAISSRVLQNNGDTFFNKLTHHPVYALSGLNSTHVFPRGVRGIKGIFFKGFFFFPQHFECTKCCGIVHVKMINFVLCEFHLNLYKKPQKQATTTSLPPWHTVIYRTDSKLPAQCSNPSYQPDLNLFTPSFLCWESYLGPKMTATLYPKISGTILFPVINFF